jgi:hypothetical protein
MRRRGRTPARATRRPSRRRAPGRPRPATRTHPQTPPSAEGSTRRSIRAWRDSATGSRTNLRCRVADRTQTAPLTEEAGWDGGFIWDDLIGYNRDLVGEFAATNILLAAAALLRSGSSWAARSGQCRGVGRASSPLKSPPWTGLSGGRIVFGVGLVSRTSTAALVTLRCATCSHDRGPFR